MAALPQPSWPSQLTLADSPQLTHCGTIQHRITQERDNYSGSCLALGFEPSQVTGIQGWGEFRFYLAFSWVIPHWIVVRQVVLQWVVLWQTRCRESTMVKQLGQVSPIPPRNEWPDFLPHHEVWRSSKGKCALGNRLVGNRPRPAGTQQCGMGGGKRGRYTSLWSIVRVTAGTLQQP